MSKKKDTARLQIYIEVTAIIFSLIAVGISLWSNLLAREANNLANQEYAANVVTSIDQAQIFTTTNDKNVNFVYGIHLTNLGGVSTSIIDASADMYWRDLHDSLQFNSIIPLVVSPSIPRLKSVGGVIIPSANYNDFRKDYPQDSENYTELKNSAIQLPLQINAKETVDVMVLIWLEFDDTVTSENSNIFSSRSINSQELSPAELAFTFRLSSGESLTTSRADSFWTK